MLAMQKNLNYEILNGAPGSIVEVQSCMLYAALELKESKSMEAV